MKKKTIKNYIKEFTEKGGTVTIEFSVHKSRLPKVFRKLKKYTPKTLAWTAHTCSTCEEYHGKGYVHVELHKIDCPYAGYNASNLLACTKKNKQRKINGIHRRTN